MKIICPHMGRLWKQQLVVFHKEIFRKSIHLCAAAIPFFLSHFYVATIYFLILIAALYATSQILALHKIQIPIVSAVTDMAARARDKGKFVLGPLTLVLGILISALFYEPKAAAAGIYALAFGDGLASLAGKIFGNLYIPFTGGKTCAGSIVCFTAIYVSSFFTLKSAGTSLILAFCGMFIEILPLKDWDNVLIPVLLGWVGQSLLHNL